MIESGRARGQGPPRFYTASGGLGWAQGGGPQRGGAPRPRRRAGPRALEKHHVPCKEVLFPNATHGVGTGAGTDADGWMLDAANFWETQING